MSEQRSTYLTVLASGSSVISGFFMAISVFLLFKDRSAVSVVFLLFWLGLFVATIGVLRRRAWARRVAVILHGIAAAFIIFISIKGFPSAERVAVKPELGFATLAMTLGLCIGLYFGFVAFTAVLGRFRHEFS